MKEEENQEAEVEETAGEEKLSITRRVLSSTFICFDSVESSRGHMSIVALIQTPASEIAKTNVVIVYVAVFERIETNDPHHFMSHRP